MQSTFIMFRFLKKLLSPEEEPAEVVRLPLDKVESFLKNRKKQGLSMVESILPEYKVKIRNIIDQARDDLNHLKGSELRNKNIATREEQIMRGNKEAYIFKTETFLSKVDPNIDPETAGDYCDNFKDELALLNKNTMRSYFVLQEFFAHESRKVAMQIKELENIVSSLESDLNKRIPSFGMVKSSFESLQGRIRLEAELRSRIKDAKSALSDLESKKDALNRKLSAIEKSRDYAEYNRTRDKKKEIEGRIKEKEDEIVQVFAVLEKALKKYERIALEPKTVNAYLDNPANALLNDPDLKVIDILASIKKKIEDDTIDLKDKKKEKNLAMIAKLDALYLKTYREGLIQLHGSKDALGQKLRSFTVVSEHKDLKYRMEHIESKIQLKQQEMQRCSAELEKQNIDDLKGQLMQSVKKAFNISLEIVDKESDKETYKDDDKE